MCEGYWSSTGSQLEMWQWLHLVFKKGCNAEIRFIGSSVAFRAVNVEHKIQRGTRIRLISLMMFVPIYSNWKQIETFLFVPSIAYILLPVGQGNLTDTQYIVCFTIVLLSRALSLSSVVNASSLSPVPSHNYSDECSNEADPGKYLRVWTVIMHSNLSDESFLASFLYATAGCEL